MKKSALGGKVRDLSGTRRGVPGLLGEVGAGGTPECPVLLSGWCGVAGSVCLWAGKASIPAAATHS